MRCICMDTGCPQCEVPRPLTDAEKYRALLRAAGCEGVTHEEAAKRVRESAAIAQAVRDGLDCARKARKEEAVSVLSMVLYLAAKEAPDGR